MAAHKAIIIGVLGCGAWGSTIASYLAKQGLSVSVFDPNPNALVGLNLPAATSMDELAAKSSVLVLAVPSAFVRDTIRQLSPKLKHKKLLNLAKGFDHQRRQTISMACLEIGGEALLKNYALLSGPSFAKEVREGKPTAVTIASLNPATARFFQRLVSSENFRTYTSQDLVGVEISGALKNVIAIAAGICDGIGLGQNSRAALITRGLSEMARLGVRLGASPLTFNGLSGMGDLVLTCCGDLSRNRRLGILMARGNPLAMATAEIGGAIEGVESTRTAIKLAKRLKVEMPITQEVYRILFANAPPKESIARLMLRSLKHEIR